MTATPIITVKPKSKRMKERVTQHGSSFVLLRTESHRVLVESLEKTWRHQGKAHNWHGWITDDEATWE